MHSLSPFLHVIDLDTMLPQSEFSCGGALPLTYSNPNVNVSTPFYNYPPLGNVDLLMDCWWYISGPPDHQVELLITDYEMADETIYIYDHPHSTSSVYLVSTLNHGNESLTSITSTRGGFTMVHDDTYHFWPKRQL